MTDTRPAGSVLAEFLEDAGFDDWCRWTLELGAEYQTWETECSLVFGFNEGTPAENDFNFCPKCGRPIIVNAVPEQ